MPERSSKPVFYDPNNRRWRWFKGVAEALGIFFTLVFCGLIASILTTPILPRLALAPVKPLLEQSHASVLTPTPLPPVTVQPQDLRAQVAGQARFGNKVETRHQELSGQKTLARAVKRFHVSSKNPVITASPQPGLNATPSPVPAGPTPTPTPLPTFAPLPPAAPNNTEVVGFYVDWDDNSFTSLKQNLLHIDKLIPEWLHLTDASGTVAPDDLVKQQEALDFIHQNRPDLPIIPLINNYNNDTQT